MSSAIILSSLLLTTPLVYGINTSPSVKPYGLCRHISPDMKNSFWCNNGPIKGQPSKITNKYGRQTIYPGPLGIQKGWCGKMLKGSNDTAAVAISTKYVPIHTQSPLSPYCGKCLCFRVVGADESTNPNYPLAAKRYFGKVFKGKVMDLCPECEDDHIDILADRPYTSATINKANPLATNFNKIPGPRGIPNQMVYSVGIWKVEWNFASCSQSCDQFFK